MTQLLRYVFGWKENILPKMHIVQWYSCLLVFWHCRAELKSAQSILTLPPQTDNAEIHGPLFKKGLPLESFVFNFVKVTRSDKWFTNTRLWVIAYLNINSIWVSIDKISFFSISISDCLNKIDMWQSPWSDWSSTAAEDDYQINTIFSWATSLCLFGEVSSLNHG